MMDFKPGKKKRGKEVLKEKEKEDAGGFSANKFEFLTNFAHVYLLLKGATGGKMTQLLTTRVASTDKVPEDTEQYRNKLQTFQSQA